MTDADKIMVLISAREYIESGWTQNAISRRADGEAVDNPIDSSAVQWCLVGGVCRAAGVKEYPDGPKSTINGKIMRGFYLSTPEQELAADVVEVLGSLVSGSSLYAHSVPGLHVVSWNDDEGRTKDEVLDLIDRAIAKLMTKSDLVLSAEDVRFVEDVMDRYREEAVLK